ncbi:expressed protein, partial [Phakopsora pachyrhizi]
MNHNANGPDGPVLLYQFMKKNNKITNLSNESFVNESHKPDIVQVICNYIANSPANNIKDIEFLGYMHFISRMIYIGDTKIREGQKNLVLCDFAFYAGLLSLKQKFEKHDYRTQIINCLIKILESRQLSGEDLLNFLDSHSENLNWLHEYFAPNLAGVKDIQQKELTARISFDSYLLQLNNNILLASKGEEGYPTIKKNLELMGDMAKPTSLSSIQSKTAAIATLSHFTSQYLNIDELGKPALKKIEEIANSEDSNFQPRHLAKAYLEYLLKKQNKHNSLEGPSTSGTKLEIKNYD